MDTTIGPIIIIHGPIMEGMVDTEDTMDTDMEEVSLMHTVFANGAWGPIYFCRSNENINHSLNWIWHNLSFEKPREWLQYIVLSFCLLKSISL